MLSHGMSTDKSPGWLCAQIGAREHYAIARALNLSGNLDALLTDAWVRPGSLLGTLQRNLGDRYHSDLAAASVQSWNAGFVGFELLARAKRISGWPLMMARNRFFQQRVTNAISSLVVKKSSPPVFFAYSYAALEPLRYAKKQGWPTVLGQIDPGPAEERLVGKLHQQNKDLNSKWSPAPETYWKLWREECDLADHIIVNSSWSRSALVEEGIAEKKITIVPLAFNPSAASMEFKRSYPDAFTEKRPLRVLFLGQVNLRKGMTEVVEAIRQLKDYPIEFSIVGPLQIETPEDLRDDPRVRWLGPVPRSTAPDYYQWADVFLFPTHSDGFGLTQLEAQAWKLPLIASRFCGEVVEEGRNGWLLPSVSAATIRKQLVHCALHPELLAAASTASGVAGRYSLPYIGATLSRLVSS